MTRGRRWSTRRVVLVAVTYLLVGLLLVPVLFPLIWMVGSSLKELNEIFANPPILFPKSLHPENFVDVFKFQPFASQYMNSLGIGLAVTLGTVVVSAMAGFAFARLQFPGRDRLFLFGLLGLLVPSMVTLVPLFRAANALGWLDTPLPVVIFPLFGLQCAFGTFFMRQFFLGIPRELEDAGRLDGLSPFGRLRHISMPLSVPALSALAVLAFLTSWNLYLEPLTFLVTPENQTVPVAITQFRDFYSGPLWNVQMAATTLTLIPPALIFLLAQRRFVEGITFTGMRG
jgi:multiple sugar transport system permease protein